MGEKQVILATSLWWMATIFGCTGCVVGPDYARPSTAIPDRWQQELEHGEFVGTNELDHWWRLLDDAVLDELIVSAGGSNLDLQAAFARISQARALRCEVASTNFPQLGVDGSFLTSKQSANAFGGGGFATFFTRDLWTLESNVAWEPDMFGRIYRQVQAADANVCVQVEAYRDILVTLYGDVAQSYVQVRTLQEQLKYAHQNVAIQERSLELAERRVEAGIAPNADRYLAQSNLAAVEASIPTLEFQLHQTLNRLSVLLGQCPGSLHDPLSLPAPIPTVPNFLPVVIPLDVVRQRPDIRQAERLIAERSAELGVATSDLYPRFSLGGNFGLSSQNLSDLLTSNSFGYGFGPSFTWPVFQAGRIRCNINGAEWAVNEALANYERTILLAFEEVENAMVGFNKERTRREALERTVIAAEKSLESVLALYRSGKVDFQNVLDTQRTLFLAQNQLAQSEGQIVIQLVTLYRALGGGWNPRHHQISRCIRSICPPHGDPSVVEKFSVSDAADRYFEIPGNKSSSNETNEESTSNAGRSKADAADKAASDPPIPLDQPERTDTDIRFEDMLKDLEERLDSTPK